MGTSPSSTFLLQDLEAVRLLLRGSSVIDWSRLSFADEAAVTAFLRVNEIDLTRPEDLDRVEELREESVEFLTRSFGYRIPEEVATMPPVQLFLLAASRGKRQMYACIILKVMHVMHHLAGRELLFKLPVSDDQVFAIVERKVVRTVEALRAAGFPIVEFAWSRKEHDSVVTKLLAKKESLAAQVYDKLRFRLITRSRDDIAPVLRQLLEQLVPFNYVVPGESVNGIVPFRALVESRPDLALLADQLQESVDAEARKGAQNEFSGPSYRVINFVADLPVRIDESLCAIAPEISEALGHVIFVLTEFQLVDAETAQHNEQGENSHVAYKARQHDRVKARLSGTSKPED